MSFAPDGICKNPKCPCARPGRVCEKFVPYKTAYCARCGWERLDHAHRHLIHNGRKP